MNPCDRERPSGAPRNGGMGLLQVTVEDQTELAAHAARLHLQVEGETLVFGNAATEKAREVRELTGQLLALGIRADDITVPSVRLNNATGVLGKNQKAEFTVMVRVRPGELPAVLGVVAGQKNARLSGLDWQFDDFEASMALAAQAMQKARRKAEVIAEAAGLRVTGLHRASDSWELPASPVTFAAADMSDPTLLRARTAPLHVGVEYRAVQTLRTHLTAEFIVE